LTVYVFYRFAVVLVIMVNIDAHFDVLIVGGGPAGANAAISYKNLDNNLEVGIIDKSVFPRDK